MFRVTKLLPYKWTHGLQRILAASTRFIQSDKCLLCSLPFNRTGESATVQVRNSSENIPEKREAIFRREMVYPGDIMVVTSSCSMSSRWVLVSSGPEPGGSSVSIQVRTILSAVPVKKLCIGSTMGHNRVEIWQTVNLRPSCSRTLFDSKSRLVIQCFCPFLRSLGILLLRTLRPVLPIKSQNRHEASCVCAGIAIDGRTCNNHGRSWQLCKMLHSQAH